MSISWLEMLSGMCIKQFRRSLLLDLFEEGLIIREEIGLAKISLCISSTGGRVGWKSSETITFPENITRPS